MICYQPNFALLCYSEIDRAESYLCAWFDQDKVFIMLKLSQKLRPLATELTEMVGQKTLRHHVHNIVGCRYLLKADFPWNDTVPNEMISNIDMLGGIVMNRIFR